MRYVVASFLGRVLCGCAGQPRAWTKADGTTPASADLQLAMTACRGEATRANMAAGENAAIATGLLGNSGEMQTVFDGCMAQHGYLAGR